MKKLIKTTKAFSLAELMIVMLILTIILAATMPILSKRAKVKAAANATVSLPTKNVGDSCTTGSIAIASDGTVLTCQGGTFKKPPSGSSAGETLYLYSASFTGSDPPTPCPTGWSDAGWGPTYTTSTSYYFNTIRSCYNINKTCSTLYLYSASFTGSDPPTPCPTGWSDAGWGPTYSFSTSYYFNTIRSCYKCS